NNLKEQWRTTGNYRSLSRAVTDVMLNQWECMVSPFRVGIQVMDALLVRSESSNAVPPPAEEMGTVPSRHGGSPHFFRTPSGSKDASELATQAKAESPEKPAMERLKDEPAVPREIDDAARWTGIRRNYTSDDVARLRGSVHIECTLARRGAEK